MNTNNMSSIPFKKVNCNPFNTSRNVQRGFIEKKWYGFGKEGFRFDIEAEHAMLIERKDSEYTLSAYNGAREISPIVDKAIGANGSLVDCPGAVVALYEFKNLSDVQKFFIGEIAAPPQGFNYNVAIINTSGTVRVFNKTLDYSWFGEKAVGFIDFNEGDTKVLVQSLRSGAVMYNDEVFVAYPKDRLPSFNINVWEDNGRQILYVLNQGHKSAIREEGNVDTICFDIDFPSDLGEFFMTVTDGFNMWISPKMHPCKGLLRIEWENMDDVEAENGVVIPAMGTEVGVESPFVFVVGADSTIAQPSYEYEEEVEHRDGRNYPIKQVIYKKFRFNFLGTEDVCDVLRLAGMADKIRIVDGEQVYNARTLSFSVDWQDQGYLGNIIVEFTTDTVVKKIGRAYKSL